MPIRKPYGSKNTCDKFSDFFGNEKQKRWGDPPYAYAYASVSLALRCKLTFDSDSTIH